VGTNVGLQILERIASGALAGCSIDDAKALTRACAEAVSDILAGHGLATISHADVDGGTSIEVLCQEKAQVYEAVVSAALMQGTGLVTLIALPDTGFETIKAAAGKLDAQLHLVGRRWYASLNDTSIEDLVSYLRAPAEEFPRDHFVALPLAA
jgi:hypothetical protein